QLAVKQGLAPNGIVSPDAFFRSIVKHAAGRAKRRRKLVEQIAAGDDLQVITDDLAALDADLPAAFLDAPPDAKKARAQLDKLKER
ncbi:hypothetical protein, partial [Klebsiella pneumoniae]|uniref:hypothetical protein n=1 Tax=Klebsiella pneumoniae TaxID=573 RepID=UPI003EE05340